MPADRSERLYPHRPLVGVGAVVWDGGRVLLERRGQPPAQGWWSLPGGLIELGETAEDAVRREVREECGIEVEVGPLFGLFEPIRAMTGWSHPLPLRRGGLSWPITARRPPARGRCGRSALGRAAGVCDLQLRRARRLADAASMIERGAWHSSCFSRALRTGQCVEMRLRSDGGEPC